MGLVLVIALWALLRGACSSGDLPTAIVDNGRKFAAAMANKNVGTILVRRYALVVNDIDFAGLPLPVLLTRNITVRGDVAALEYWPFLFLNGSHKVGAWVIRGFG